MRRHHLDARSIQSLQRTAGNRAVTDLIAPVQRRIQIDDWSYDPSLFDKQATRQDQFKSDAILWYHTLFHRDPNVRGEQRTRLRHQQYLLRRHFLAMAAFGVESGSQDTGTFNAYNDPDVPLAAIASHGGRFGYEASKRQTGEAFHNLLMRGKADRAPEIAKTFKKRGTRSASGIFERISTHGQKFIPGHGWKETHEKGKAGLGMNIAFGGTGHTVTDTKGKATTIGPEGWANKGKKRNGYQLGTTFMKQDYAGENSRLMVGFEGTSPKADNQLGASHGVIASVLGAGLHMKKFMNDRSLTGQGKAGSVGMPTGMGAMRATVDDQKLNTFKAAIDALDTIRLRGRPGAAYAETLFKDLLTSTNASERAEIIKEMTDAKTLIENSANASALLTRLANADSTTRRGLLDQAAAPASV